MDTKTKIRILCAELIALTDAMDYSPIHDDFRGQVQKVEIELAFYLNSLMQRGNTKVLNNK